MTEPENESATDRPRRAGDGEPAATEPGAATTTGAGIGERPDHARSTALMAAAIFFAALVLRCLHWREIAQNDPFFTIASVDGAIYHVWAQEILQGNWLGEGVLFLGPLYPTFMAFVYAAFGESLSALKAVQSVVGATSCVLIFYLARACFDTRTALLSGVIAAGYGMHVFYGGTAMIVNIQVPLVLGLALAAVQAIKYPTTTLWVLCGVLLGLSALARQTTLLLAPMLALFVLFGMRDTVPFPRRLFWGVCFGLATVAMILPFTIRNYLVGDDLVLLNSTGGANFYMGNQSKADGTWQVPSIGARHRVDNPLAMREAFTAAAEKAEGRRLKPSAVSRYWLSRGLDEIRTDPARWIRLEGRKAGLFFNAYEVWNNRSFEVSRRFSWVLRLPLFSFGLIGPFALFGLVLAAPLWRSLFPVYATIAAYLVSALLFFVLSRYRLPAVMLMIPLAAFAAVDLFDRLIRRDFRAAGLRLAGLGALALFVHLPLANENRMHMAYYNLGNKFRELERFDEAVLAYRESLAENPRALSTHNNLALTLELAGRRPEAIAAWTRVGELAARAGDQRRMERAARHLLELGVAGEPTATPPATAAP